jgi:hypothetical protein
MGSGGKAPPLFASALAEGEWSASRSSFFVLHIVKEIKLRCVYFVQYAI